MKKYFASDTVAGTCPEAWDALASANDLPYLSSYGEDEISERASAQIQALFGRPCQVFFTTSGTAANSLALSFLVEPCDSVLCLTDAHIQIDEANAPEFYTRGAKLVGVTGVLGRLSPADLEPLLLPDHGYHAAAVKAVSLTQATEYGTVYSPKEIAEFENLKRRNPGLKIHMDGARFANAVSALGCSPKDLVNGVDILTFGSTKNGGGLSEAIVLFDEELFSSSQQLDQLKRKLKQGGQLTAKSRYLAAGWTAMLKDDVWLKNAAHANAMAQSLAKGLGELKLPLRVPVESNQVFVDLDRPTVNRLKAQGWEFYHFPNIAGYRFVCSWSTRDEYVQELLQDLSSR